MDNYKIHTPEDQFPTEEERESEHLMWVSVENLDEEKKEIKTEHVSKKISGRN